MLRRLYTTLFLSVLLGLIATPRLYAATAYVTEFRERPPVTYQAAIVPALVNQALTFTTASVASAAFNYQTALVRVQCSVECWVVFGASPTATISMLRLTAGQTEYFAVVPNSDTKIAVIGL